jgi:hypothetical protein
VSRPRLCCAARSLQLLSEILKTHQSAQPFLDGKAQVVAEKRPIDSGLVCLDDRVPTEGTPQVSRGLRLHPGIVVPGGSRRYWERFLTNRRDQGPEAERER